MSVERAFVDTNILVYALYQESEHHGVARALVDRAKNSGAGLCTAPQVLAEFYSVVTDTRRVSTALSPAEAIEEIEKILEWPGIAVLATPADIAERWLDLAKRYPVKRQDVFDLQLVALMLAHGVKRIYTFNAPDFQRFTELQVSSMSAGS